MSEFPSNDMTSRGTSAPPASYRLFVSTPTGQTFSLRNLARTLPAYALRAQLELVAGIPSVTYTLHYGSLTLDSDAVLAFGENVQTGALLSLRFDGDWGRLYAAVSVGNAQLTAQVCRLSPNGSDDAAVESRDPDVAESAETSAVEHVRFVTLFKSCQQGDYDMASWLIRTDARLLERTTQFGRTALHAAAAADQPKVLQLLLSSGARIYDTDVFGKKPLDVATQLSCYVAERLLKYWVLRRRTAWGGSKRCGGQTGSDVKCSERVGTGHSRVTRRAVSASASPRKSRTQTENVPRLSSADHHVTAYARRCVNESRSYDSRINTWAETGVWAKSANPGDPTGPCTDLVYETVRNARSAKGTHNVHVSRPTSFSAQSAKYYRGRFHRSGEDDDTHSHRPATANSRFRAWKTWLVELDEREAERRLEEEQKLDRRERNERAYRRWLAKKARDGDTTTEPEVDDHTGTTAASRDVNAAAFQKWLDDKRQVLAEADRKRRESLRQRDGGEKKVAYNRRVTVFEFCDTDPVAAHPQSPSDYIGAYRNWLLKKRRHEAWREDDDYDDEDDMLTREQVEAMRQVLVLDGMSHEEWLGQKEREGLLGNKPLVLAPRRRARPTGSQAVCIAVVAD